MNIGNGQCMLCGVLSVPDALNVQFDAAAHKVATSRHPLRYLIASMLGGAFIGVAVVLMACTAGPFQAAGSPATKLVSGLVFATGFVLVVFAGGELVTSNMMTLPQGVLGRRISIGSALGTLLFCFVGNLIGSLAFAWLVVQSGVLTSNADAGAMLASLVQTKATEPTGQLFVRAILCNFLVGLAIWMCARVTSDGAKFAAIFWPLLAFVSIGFEHVVANMTTFGIGIFSGTPGATWGAFGRNLLIVGLGNLVGGAVCVGLAFYVVAGHRPQREVPVEPHRGKDKDADNPAVTASL